MPGYKLSPEDRRRVHELVEATVRESPDVTVRGLSQLVFSSMSIDIPKGTMEHYRKSARIRILQAPTPDEAPAPIRPTFTEAATRATVSEAADEAPRMWTRDDVATVLGFVGVPDDLVREASRLMRFVERLGEAAVVASER
jgi:hypothetical protein